MDPRETARTTAGTENQIGRISKISAEIFSEEYCIQCAIGAANPTVAEIQPAMNPIDRMPGLPQQMILTARTRHHGGEFGVANCPAK